MATYSSILAWKIPWTEKPGRLQSMRSQRVGHSWATKHTGSWFIFTFCEISVSTNTQIIQDKRKVNQSSAMQMKLLWYSFSLALRITSVFYSWSIFRIGSGDLGNQKIYIYGSLYFNFLKSSNILIYSPLKLIYRNLIESLAGSKECASNMSVLCLLTQSYPSLCNPMDCSPPGTSVHGDSSGKNTGVGCHALLQGAAH